METKTMSAEGNKIMEYMKKYFTKYIPVEGQ